MVPPVEAVSLTAMASSSARAVTAAQRPCPRRLTTSPAARIRLRSTRDSTNGISTSRMGAQLVRTVNTASIPKFSRTIPAWVVE